MIPVLYEKNETTFTHNGLGTLPDAALCLITEERNGVFELSMEYPVTGIHYEELQIGRTIKAKNAYKGAQLFDIYAISRPMNGLVTVSAQHVSYRLNHKVLLPCTAASCAAAMTAIENHILDGSDFDFWTDKSVTANWKCEVPKPVRSALGGTEGSVLDVYGPGEYEWDNFTVKFHLHRGADTGVSIRYGKNLTDLVADEDGADVYTACVAYYTAQNGTVVYTNKVKTTEWSATNDLVSTIDMAQFFTPPDGAADSWTPTTSEMETKALQLMTANNVAAVAQNLKVEFELLSQTKEYKHLAALERVNLCDTITVTHPGMGVNVKVKVIKTVWNVLLDRYDSLELGEPTANFANTITGGLSQSLEDIKAELGDKVDWSHMDIAIANATELITGGAGGYVVLGQNADGEPNEIFIMDDPDQEDAVNVIRLNKNGIGFSTSGINGPYTNAWTIDGHLVADFIDTGVLDATIIKAGILTDENGTNYWDMETGEFSLSASTAVGNGTLGGNVVACDVEYGNSTSSSTAPSTWTTNANWEKGKYLWTRVKYTTAGGATSYSAARLVANDKGMGNAEVVEQYYLSTSSSTQTGGSWSETQQTWVSGRHYWTRSKITWSDGTVTYTTPTLAKALTSGNQSTDDLDAALDQDEVFDRLTDGGTVQGIYMQNSQLYINASYIATGILKDTNENFKLLLGTGEMTMKKGSINLGVNTSADWFSIGSFNTNGEENNDSTKTRSIFLPSSCHTLTVTGGYNFVVLAWQGDTWKGYYKTNGTIATGTSNLNRLSTCNFDTMRANFPNYSFRVTVRNSANSTIDWNDFVSHLSDTNLYNFSVNDAGDLSAHGSLTTIDGHYKNVVDNGYIYYYYDGGYMGKVGTSLFTGANNSTNQGMMFDIGYDAELGGIAIQETSGAAADPAFYYSRTQDAFITEKPITGHGSSITFAEDDGANDGLWIYSDVDVQISAASGVSIGGSGGLHVNGSTATLNGQALLTAGSLNGYATQTWVQNQNYLTSSSLSGYATQSWVQSQGYTTTADINLLNASNGALYGYSTGIMTDPSKIWVDSYNMNTGQTVSTKWTNLYSGTITQSQLQAARGLVFRNGLLVDIGVLP